MNKKYLRKFCALLLCTGLCIGSVTSPVSASEKVGLNDLIIKWGGIVETEPNYSMKTNAGKFAPNELEYGLFLKPDMKFGPGKADGMMAPLKDMITALPGELAWDGKTDGGKVTIKLNQDTLIYTLGSTAATLNDKTITIPSSQLAPYAYKVKGEIFEDGSDYYAFYLPVKFTAEALGAQVMWNEPMKRVEIGWLLYYQKAADEPTTGGKYTTRVLEAEEVPLDQIAIDNHTLTDSIKTGLNIVGFQNTDGGWQKTNLEYDLTQDDYLAKLAPHYSTIDNGATFGENRFLARLIQVMKSEAAKNSPLHQEIKESIVSTLKKEMPQTLAKLNEKGRLENSNLTYDGILNALEKSFWDSMHYFLNAQVFYYNDSKNPTLATSGGWAQYFPYSVGYYKNITFNDNAMTSVLETFMDVIYDTDTESGFWTDYTWVREEANKTVVAQGDIPVKDIQRAFDLGVRYTIDAQISVDGYGLTGWCQQYDRYTGKPVMGRAYEHPSIATGESTRVMLFLTRIRPLEIPPDSLFQFNEVANSIIAYNSWVKDIAKTGLSSFTVTDRTREIAADRFVAPLLLENGAASKAEIFGRFYNLTLNKDGGFDILYSNRDSVIIFEHNKVYHERRSGYNFTNTNTKANVEKQYEAWAKNTGNGYEYLNGNRSNNKAPKAEKEVK